MTMSKCLVLNIIQNIVPTLQSIFFQNKITTANLILQFIHCRQNQTQLTGRNRNVDSGIIKAVFNQCHGWCVSQQSHYRARRGMEKGLCASLQTVLIIIRNWIKEEFVTYSCSCSWARTFKPFNRTLFQPIIEINVLSCQIRYSHHQESQ